MKNITLAVVISMALTLGSSAFAQTDSLKIGKTGHLTLKQEAQVGNTLLAPGYYEVRQRRTSTSHYMEFTLVTDNYYAGDGYPAYDWEVVAKVPCKVEPLGTPAKRTVTQVAGGSVAQITGLEIRGENVEHVF
jgi:hypothetical protein